MACRGTEDSRGERYLPGDVPAKSLQCALFKQKQIGKLHLIGRYYQDHLGCMS